MANNRICSIEGCDKPAKHRGWCGMHYKRWLRHGDLAGGRTSPGDVLKFYTETVLLYTGEACLTWPYARAGKGYAIMRVDGKNAYVTRLICTAVHGEPPTIGHEAAHLCGKGHEGCVNPKHLAWETCAENEADKLRHGTSNRGTRNGRAKLTESDVLQIRRLQGTMTGVKIAAMFGVNRDIVYGIHRREQWKWLPD